MHRGERQFREALRGNPIGKEDLVTDAHLSGICATVAGGPSNGIFEVSELRHGGKGVLIAAANVSNQQGSQEFMLPACGKREGRRGEEG